MKLKPQIKAKPALNKRQKVNPPQKPQKNNLSAAQKPQKGGKATLAPNKKHAAPAKVLPPKKVLEEEEDEDSEDDEVDDLAGLLDLEAESGEEDDVDSGEEEEAELSEDDEEGVEEDDDESDDELGPQIEDASDGDEEDDDQPIEAPIVKVEKKAKQEKAPKPVAAAKTNPAEDNIKTGLLPKNISFERIVVVKNVPKTSKQKDLVAIFGKHGTIVHIQTSHDDGHKVCLVAYEDAKAARSALAENKKATLKDTKLDVTAQPKDATTAPVKVKELPKSREEHHAEVDANKARTISVGHLAKGTKEADIRKHFAGCGPIASINLLEHKKKAFVVFANEKDVAKAKKLHQTVLKDATVTVRGADDAPTNGNVDPNLTIVLKNQQHLKSVQVEKLRAIFSKCGEIADINVICGRDVLAFITFKHDKSAKKALKLHGTSSDGLDIQIDQFKAPGKNSVVIHNLKPGATEADVRQHFEATGEIERVTIQHSFATVQFKDTNAFCKSFLLNESSLQGQLIFLEPFSAKKQKILKASRPKPFLGKRPHAPPKSQPGGPPKKKFKADKGKRQNGV